MAGLDRYRAVFREPGAAPFCAASFVARMPIAIYPLGIVLIISARDGKYGFAGVLSACVTFGAALGAPLLARLVDRYGQRRLLLPAAVVHTVAALLLASLLRGGAADAALVGPAIVLGLSYLSIGSLVRARWSWLLANRPELSTALSVESVLDELIFTVGPLIATVLVTQTVPELVLYLCLALVGVGSVWLAAQRATEPPPHPSGSERRPSALRSPGLTLLTLAGVAMGAVFASAEVSIVAFCGQHGHRSLSGLVLAGVALGSGTAGLVYGAITWRADVLRRYRLQLLVFALLPWGLFGATNVAILAVCGFVVGLGFAPALITAFGVVQQTVPAHALTEGMSWVTTGINLGAGLGAAVVGEIADQHGARVAFLVTTGAALLACVLGLAARPRAGAFVPDAVVPG